MKIHTATRSSRSVSIFFLALVALPCLSAQIDGPMGPWADQDIGDTGATGSTAVTNGVFSINGSGADIWGSADAFHYVYQNWSGDGAIVIRVLHVDETDTYARAGIMFRATLDPGSRHAFVFHRAGGRTAFQARLDSGDNAWVEGSWVNEPYWVKLVRLQDTFIAYDSPDGTNWNEIGTTNINMPTNILVGLAVTSHNYGTLCTATLDGLQMSSRPAAPSKVKALRAFDHIEVSWTDNSTNETGFRIEEFIDWGDTSYWIARSVGPNVTNYTETYLPAVYFRVQATNLMGSAYSETAIAADGALDPIPPQWQSVDIGAPTYSGGASFRDGEFSIVAAGNGIGGTSDQFHFVYQKLYGDGEIVGEYPGYAADYFASYDGKGGIMFRQSIDPDAACIFYYIGAGGGGFGYEVRNTAGANAETNAISNSLGSTWVRLTRTNNQFTLSLSNDGQIWTKITSQHIDMRDPIFAGMAASSGVYYYEQQSMFPQIRFAAQHGVMKAVALNTNQIALIANGTMGRTYGIESSTNLRDWTRVAITVVNTNGTIAFTNTDAVSYPQRFYRTVLMQ
jgi:regulation of enolase protein 1 (concanavalin A-like superfamily)